MDVYDFDPRNLPMDYYGAIGGVTVAFARTGEVAQMLLAGLLGLDAEYGTAVTTDVPVPLLTNIIRAAAQIRLEASALSQLGELLADLDRANAMRNAIVQRQWCRHPDGRVFTVKKLARKGAKFELVEMSIVQIARDAGFIHHVGMRLMDFMVEHGIAPEETPGSPAQGGGKKDVTP